MTKVAMCPNCNVPLVSTFAFARAEFYCLDCGGHFGWLEPIGADETPVLLEEMESRRLEWEEHAGNHLLTPGARHLNCARCMGEHSRPATDHLDHATDAEKEAHRVATEWIAARVKAEAP